MLIVALAAGLLSQFFPCCAFAIRSFSKVSATPDHFFVYVCMLDFLAYVTVSFQPNRRGSHIPSLWMVHAECVFVAGIHLSRA